MIKLALIGLGSMGKNYLNTLSSFKNAQITHLCSKTQRTLDLYSDEFYKTTDYKSLAGRKQIDGIIIATPASTHFQIVSFFLKINIPLLIEKPLTTNYLDAINLLRLQKNTAVLVGHTLLYHPTYLKIKQNISKIGKIEMITFEGANNNPRKNTSLIYDWGSHGISLFIDLLKDSPKNFKLITYKKQEQFIELNYKLNFKGNINCFLNMSWVSPQKKRSLTIHGSKGKLIFDDFAKSKLTLNNKPLPYNPTPPLTVELEDFLKSIETKQKPDSDLKFGVEVIKVLDMLSKLADSNFKRS